MQRFKALVKYLKNCFFVVRNDLVFPSWALFVVYLLVAYRIYCGTRIAPSGVLGRRLLFLRYGLGLGELDPLAANFSRSVGVDLGRTLGGFSHHQFVLFYLLPVHR